MNKFQETKEEDVLKALNTMDNTQGGHGHKLKTPRTPKTPNTPTVEQLLHGDNPTRWSSSNMSPTLHKDHDQEEDHFHQNKKLSVLAKVKERAKKWRQSLVKKRHSHDGNHTPSWGVALEDDENEEVPEYLGAPMYESETAPKGFKEHAEQNERAGSLIFEKHVFLAGGDDLPGNLPVVAGSKKKTIIEDRKDKPLTIRKTIAEEKSRVHFPDSPRKTTTSDQEAKEKWPAAVESGAALDNLSIDKKAVTEEKLETPNSPTTPKFVDAKDTLCSPRSDDDKRNLPNNLSMDPTEVNEETNPATIPKNNNNKSPAETVTQKLALPAYTTAVSGATHAIASKIPGMSFMNSSALNNGAEDRGMSSEGTWDKGVSVSEYIKNKFEPGDDERALSQVISETMSPRRTPGDKGVMEKVKEAVTSLLHTEVQQQQQAPRKTTAPNPSTPKFSTSRGSSSTPKAAAANPTPKITSVNSMTRAAGSSSTQKLSTPNSSISTSSASNLSTRVPPASTYKAQEADQEEHQGRILQAN